MNAIKVKYALSEYRIGFYLGVKYFSTKYVLDDNMNFLTGCVSIDERITTQAQNKYTIETQTHTHTNTNIR